MPDSHPTRPNLIFMMPDQLRHDFVGCYGADFVKTPNIDRLAARGVRYTRAYSCHPVCVPARASLLTGMNALRNGVMDNGQWLRPNLAEAGVHTWPELLDDAGYYTARIGKMHFYPWYITHGFQYRSAAEDKRWIKVRDEYYHHLRAHGERKYHGNEHEGYHENKGAIINRLPWELSTDHFVGEEACRFIRTYGDDAPFAMMVGFPGPHCPYDPNQEWLDRIDPDAMPAAIPENPDNSARLRQGNIQGNKGAWNGVDYTEFTDAHKRKIRAHYAASVEQIDYEVGQILETLEETGKLENTVIIFASDHGDYLGDHNLIGKGTFYEASCHVPMIVHMPWATESVVRDDLVQLTDVMATLLTFGGVDLPGYIDAHPLPGLGLAGESARSELYGMLTGAWMAFDGRWKLCKYATGDQHLFDLEEDPTEQNNRLLDPDASEIRLRLDDLLTQEIMRSSSLAFEERRVYTGNSMWNDDIFGREAWVRPYPQKIG